MPKDDQDDATLFDPYFAWEEHTVPHDAESLDALIAAARHQLPAPEAPLGFNEPDAPSLPAPTTKAARRLIVASAGVFGLLLAGAAVAIHSSRGSAGTRPSLPPEFVLPPRAPRVVSESYPSGPSAQASQAHTMESPKSGPTILYAVPEAPVPTAASPRSDAATVARSADGRATRRRHNHHRQDLPITYDCQGVPILP